MVDTTDMPRLRFAATYLLTIPLLAGSTPTSVTLSGSTNRAARPARPKPVNVMLKDGTARK